MYFMSVGTMCVQCLVVVSAQNAHLENQALSAQLRFGERERAFQFVFLTCNDRSVTSTL